MNVRFFLQLVTNEGFCPAMVLVNTGSDLPGKFRQSRNVADVLGLVQEPEAGCIDAQSISAPLRMGPLQLLDQLTPRPRRKSPALHPEQASQPLEAEVQIRIKQSQALGGLKSWFLRILE